MGRPTIYQLSKLYLPQTVFKSSKFFSIFLATVKQTSKEKGVYYVTRYGIGLLLVWLTKPFFLYYYTTWKSRTFTFQRATYGYFFHNYKATWRNERAIEIPIIWEIIKKYQAQKILEVGNVLSHYLPVNHDIVDKYEKAEGLINQDIVDLQPSKNYDLIVSISTLEHVGWDEEYTGMYTNPPEPTKILDAFENLKRCLAPGGKIVVTLPMDYNREMDRLLRERKIQFTQKYYLKRISADNQWIEVDRIDVQDVKYGEPFPNANGLIIGVIEN